MLKVIVVIGIILVYLTFAIGVWKSAGGKTLQREDKFLCFMTSISWIVMLPLFAIIMVMDVMSSWIGDKISKGFSLLSDWKERNS